MKGWLAHHEGKWYPIKNVEDTGIPAHEKGGGNVYYLEGLDMPVHQSKIKNVKPPEHEKCEVVDVSADGKMDRVEGSEPLKKDPKARWGKLKKALDNAASIMSIEDEMSPPQPDEQAPEAAQQPESEEQSQEQEEQQGAPEVQLPESEEQDGDNSQDSEEKIVQALKDEGYSEPEIAYIVHGHHAPEMNETDSAKAAVTNAMGDVDVGHAKRQADLEHEHARRMNDVEYEKAKSDVADPEVEKNHRQRMLDLEYETDGSKKREAELQLAHKQRMMDLEYDKAKQEANKEDPTDEMKQAQLEFELEMKRKEKELELEYKEKELKLKLKLQEEAAKQKAEHAAAQAEEDAKTNAAVKKEQAKHKITQAKEPPEKSKDK